MPKPVSWLVKCPRTLERCSRQSPRHPTADLTLQPGFSIHMILHTRMPVCE